MVSLSSETPFCRTAGSGGSHKPLALLKLAQPLAYARDVVIKLGQSAANGPGDGLDQFSGIIVVFLYS